MSVKLKWLYKSEIEMIVWEWNWNNCMIEIFKWLYECEIGIFIYLFIKNICVCNAQLMQKAQMRRYKTVAAI